MLPEDFLVCLANFRDCFTAPSFQRFLTLITGWILCTSKHTVTSVMRAAGVVGKREHGGYHRFFNTAAWNADDVGLALMALLITLLPKTGPIRLTVDDTLARHTGKHIAGAAMHRDPLLSTGDKPFFHFGHNWVILAVVLDFPRWGKVFSLPVLVRLYRTEKLNQKLGRPHRKKTELCAELLELVAENFPGRRFLVIGDNAYVNRSVIRPLPVNTDFLGRGRMDAALYARPSQPKNDKGRPAIRGDRIASPAWRAQHNRWTTIQARIYGKQRTVKVQKFDALWYIVGRGRVLRFVLIRDWPGHKKDDVLVTTELTMTAEQIIESYCARWSLEETIGWVKSRLGFEDPQNRKEKAVHRTAPMALWTYSLVVYWYATWSQGRRRLAFRVDPWNRNKLNPTFADMLATLRRESWTVWISARAGKSRLDQKYLGPLLDVAANG
jgi:hypothetical protein